MSAQIIELGEKMPCVTYYPGQEMIPSGSSLVRERWADVW